MYTPFEEMADTSRVWVYQADQKLSEEDKATISAKCQVFLDQWAAHGAPLKSSYEVMHDQFLIVSVDESVQQASGCSIDASVNMVKALEQELSIHFFDRTRIYFLEEGEIVPIPLGELKSQIERGRIHPTTTTFNPSVSDIQSLKNNWKVEAQNSWLKRYFQ